MMLQLLQFAESTIGNDQFMISKDQFGFSFNIFVVLFLLIVIAAGASGYRVGFLRLLVTIASVFLSLVLTLLMVPAVHAFFVNSTSMLTSLQLSAEKYVGEELDWYAVEYFNNVKRSYSDERWDLYGKAGLPAELNNADSIAPYLDTLSDEQQDQLVDSLPAPAKFREAMKRTLKNPIDIGGKRMSTFSQRMTGAYAVIASWGILYAVVYIIVQLIVTIILTATGVVKKIPLFNTINQVGGLLLGLAFSVVVMWIVFMFVLAMCHTIPGAGFMKTIELDPLMRFLYDFDIFTNFIQSK